MTEKMTLAEKLHPYLVSLLALENHVRDLMQNPKNLIQSGQRCVVELELAKLSAMRAITFAMEVTNETVPAEPAPSQPDAAA